MNKKLLALAAMATLTLALNATASAQIVTDDAGQLHYTMCKAGQEASFNAGAAYDPRPVDEVMDITEAEYNATANLESGPQGAWHKSDRQLRPVNEIMKMSPKVFTEFSNRGNCDTAK